MDLGRSSTHRIVHAVIGVCLAAILTTSISLIAPATSMLDRWELPARSGVVCR